MALKNDVRVVLIIEDENSFREALQMAIGDEGYDVLTASNGVEALQILEHSLPDLILLDIQMPVMNGLEFLDVYRTKYTQHIPIIVCSTRHQSKRPEVTAYLSKPVDMDDLLQTVHTYILR